MRRGSYSMLAAWVLWWIAFDWWQARPDPQFVADYIPLFAWYALAALGLAAWLRSRCNPRLPFGTALSVVVTLVPIPLSIATLGVTFLDDRSLMIAAILGTACLLLYLLRRLRSLTGTSQRFAAASSVALLLGFLWLSDRMNVIPDLWTTLDIEPAVASTDNSPADEESLLFSQQAKIDRALASVARDGAPGSAGALHAGRPVGGDAAGGATAGGDTAGGAPGGRAFFLGFAGVGEEKVFAQEIDLASHVLGRRYAIGDRSVELINDARDLDGAPLASLSSLQYALRGLAAKMDLERDVLFLSISSHGSQDPAIAVSVADLPFNDVTDEDLSQALQQSGIQWRVIIVSACYAGGFIDSLKNPRTIVIAAAAADRTSFGCGSDSDLTYFGEAFYRDALPAAATLRAAFDEAKASISLRERREHVEASKPQAYFGAEMEKKLAHLTEKAAH